MLYLISLGISDEKDVSLKALEAGRMCDSLYVEWYTTQMNTTTEKLEKMFGRKIRELGRSSLEEKSGKILREAGVRDVGILVGGDVLFATTHLSLILDCRKQDVPYEIVHGSSILTAVGECGLSLYKLGPVVSVPRWQKNYRPVSFFQTILANKKMGLHTLLLLEQDMSVQEALDILLQIERKRHKQVFRWHRIIAISSLGSSREQIIQYAAAKNLRPAKPPAVLILPGNLNAFEREFLESL